MSVSAAAIERARLALDGLSVGDGFGERFFLAPEEALRRIKSRHVPPGPWRWTDDTEMALSIVAVLEEEGRVDQDRLAALFAERFDEARGYGAAAMEILIRIRMGGTWRSLAPAAFRGMGSFGNGSAMRVAPLGGFFADDLPRAVEEAGRSAEITHSHPEGIAGAIAVATAAALAWQGRARPLSPTAFLQAVLERTPAGYTHDGIAEALALPKGTDIVRAATTLGNGSGITAPDTVPFCLWIVATRPDDFAAALWDTVAALGDRDTTCAIVGGILALRVGKEGIPSAWLSAREPLPSLVGGGEWNS